MASKVNKSLIGAFVIGAIVLVTIAVIIFGSGKIFKEKTQMVFFFDGSVKGLGVGAPIVFRGVKLGVVTEVDIEIRPQDMKTRIPVYGEIFQGTVRVWGDPIDYEADPPETIERLIKKGLRARLEMQSLVTGLLQINLDYFPDEKARFVKSQQESNIIEIPTIPSELEKLRATLEELPLRELFSKFSNTLDGVEKVINNPNIIEMLRDLRTAAADARKLINNADQWVGTIGEDAHLTLGDIQGLVNNTDAQIEPLAKNANSAITAARKAFRQGEKTLAFKGGKPEKMADSFIGAADAFRETLIAAKPAVIKAEAAIENIRSITHSDSPDRYQINNMLKELSAAARAIRNWAEYLERHPEALLRGKGGTRR